MPTKICEKCGLKISYSKADKFENIHICFRKKFRERLEEKPIIIDDKVIEIKELEVNDEISNDGTSDSNFGEAEEEAESVPVRDKRNRRK